ncbi:MAG: replicative DNA helicase [Chlamydiae bacterium]|nr:replicative DNA helicase [Chlamydiota bacterium]
MTIENLRVKVAPHSKESEMMVLGCMLTSVNSLNVAADALDESDFYFNEHKIIFQVLKNAYRADKPADIHIVAEELKRQGKLGVVGGVAYVTTLAQYAGTSAYIEEYVSLVSNKAILRRMIHAAQVVEKAALEEPEDVHSALDDAQAYFFTISQTASSAAGLHIRELILGSKASAEKPFLKELQEKQEFFAINGAAAAGITGVATHFVDLDKMINGMNNSNLMILAARPAMGKTALALNIAENICFKSKIPVGIFSLEMSAKQLLHRLICSQANVESEKVKTGALTGLEFQRIVEAVGEMQQHTMIIDDQPGLKITDLRARARRMKENFNIGFLVIDYLQLISGSGQNRGAENRQVEISEISRLLKNLARELDIPIICLSQLSRKVEDRAGHRPMMSDLRESGCLTGDTLIQDTDSGRLYPIKELAERENQTPFRVNALDKNLKMSHHKMVKVFYSGRKKVFELKTRTGQVIKASSNHRFLKLEGWTALEDLKVGDKLGIPRKVVIREPQAILEDSELVLLANILAEDYLLPIHPPYYTSTDEENTSKGLCVVQKGDCAHPSLEIKQSDESDVYWDEVLSIIELGEEDVYDATVEGVHNFVANDIIVHNSIEQDSDIVMFLLRREYYDPLDKPGMAELIVAKNRHGAIGSVHLTYRKEVVQFGSYTATKAVAQFRSPNNEDDPFKDFS